MKVNRSEIKSGADLSGADLSGASLSRANLCDADLSRASLFGANLCDAKNIPASLAARLLVPPEEGSFIAFKKLQGGIICKLLIPEDAKRSSATTRKCRASKAIVLEGEGVFDS